MAIVYLDVDDEITTAAARIRTAEEVDVALVLPAGSRIATSRINFRLLAREASSRSRRLAIVAPEASTRALAASAGLPAFASVVEYGEARGQSDAEPAVAPAPVVPAPVEPTVAAAAPMVPAVAASASVIASPPLGDSPPAARPPDGVPGSLREGARPRPAVGASTGLSAGRPGPPPRRRWPLVAAIVLAVILVAGTGAAVGYVLLPTTTVTLRLAVDSVGPIVFTGTADPDAVVADAATATIPASRITLPLSATGTFKATGKRVVEAPARGSVQWQNCDPSRSYTIPSGTVARTAGGVGFATSDGILVPVAILSGTPPNLRVKCQVRSVDVVAVRKGPVGNVAPGAIRVVPGTYDPGLVLVTNPAATSGGIREEFPKVVAKDVAAAVAALTAQLDEQLTAAASSPPGLATNETAYPETARRGEPVPSEPSADIVGREAGTFDLTLTADGSVVAADPTPLEAIAAARVAAAVPEGMQLREGSLRVAVGPGIVEGETIRYPVVARAEAVRDITAEKVRGLVRGMTPADARELLADYGSVEIVVWPEWVSTITTIDGRLVITVEGVPPAEPTLEPAPTATPAMTSPPPSQSGPPPASAAP
jgi:hypothetical protein